MINKIKQEYIKANQKFPNFNSPHEGYAVILEELDELWDEIKKIKYPVTEDELKRLEKEAIQVGAMALKFLYSLDGFKNLHF